MFVKTFSGAKTTCINNQTKPLPRNSLDHFILHVGTNELPSAKSSEERAGSIIGIDHRLGMKSMLAYIISKFEQTTKN